MNSHLNAPTVALLVLVLSVGCRTGQPSSEDPAPLGSAEVEESPSAAESAEIAESGSGEGQSELGGELYGRVCVTCHGASGDGRGLEQELFGFDAPVDQWTYGPTPDGIVQALNSGVHESSMQPFPEFTLEEQQALAFYVLSLRGKLLDSM